MRQINVMIVDRSAVVRQVLSSMLAADAEIGEIRVAADPLFALEKMGKRWPDVIVLDTQMPRMDGIEFLRKIMAERPTPVVFCPTDSEADAEAAMLALAAGAVCVVTKPESGLSEYLRSASDDLVHAVKAAANANVHRRSARAVPPDPLPIPPKLTADVILPLAAQAAAHATERVVAIGTSTGGTVALEAVLTALPRSCPGLVIVQHMPEKFTEAFAIRLDGLCRIEVREARHGDRVRAGLALIAPGGRHMLLRRDGGSYHVDVVDGPLVSRHRPSVDVLFRSVARFAGHNAMGVIMTGMGDDGAQGLREMHEAGATTIAQDEDTCVVYGMPKEAVKLGAVDRVLPLGEIPVAIVKGRHAVLDEAD